MLRVRQAGRRTDFLLKSLNSFWRGKCHLGEELEGDRAFHAPMDGLEDLPHAPGTNLLLDGVLPEVEGQVGFVRRQVVVLRVRFQQPVHPFQCPECGL